MKALGRVLGWAMVMGVGLVGCGSSQPQQLGAQSQALYLPLAGAAEGLGGQHPLNRVMVSPNTQEAELLRLINEVRTQGTVNGKDAIAGSCVDGSFEPGTLRPLSYSGPLAYAAVKHARFMANVGYMAHREVATDAEVPNAGAYFYGATREERVARSLSEAGLAGDYGFVATNSGENVAGGTPGTYNDGLETPAEVMAAWMDSEGHCLNLMDPDWAFMGTGYVQNPQPGAGGTLRRHKNSWVQLFSKGSAAVEYTYSVR